MSFTVKAGVVYRPNIIKINGISVYRSAAEDVFNNAKENHLDILDAYNNDVKVDKIINNVDININNSKLMDEIIKVCEEVMTSSIRTVDRYVYKESKQMNMIIHIDKDTEVIMCVILY